MNMRMRGINVKLVYKNEIDKNEIDKNEIYFILYKYILCCAKTKINRYYVVLK